jgi:hypothetical protein
MTTMKVISLVHLAGLAVSHQNKMVSVKGVALVNHQVDSANHQVGSAELARVVSAPLQEALVSRKVPSANHQVGSESHHQEDSEEIRAAVVLAPRQEALVNQKVPSANHPEDLESHQTKALHLAASARHQEDLAKELGQDSQREHRPH